MLWTWMPLPSAVKPTVVPLVARTSASWCLCWKTCWSIEVCPPSSV
jgi:hypothetical protein